MAKTEAGKIPYRIKLKNTEIFSTAGLYETWKGPDQKIIKSFTIITRAADPLIAHLHDRMPFMLMPEQESLWLDGNVPTKDVIENMQPVPADYLTWYRVSDRVNKVRENDPGLIEAV